MTHESHSRKRVSRLLDSRFRGNDVLGVFKYDQHNKPEVVTVTRVK